MTRLSWAMFAYMLALTIVLAPSVAAPPAPGTNPATDLRDKILTAHAKALTYSAKAEFNVRQKQGRWTNDRRTWYTVAYERPGRLALDHPDYRLVVENGKMRAVVRQVSGHHVEMPLASIDYKALQAALPGIFGNPPLPELVMLLSSDPMGALTGLAAAPVQLVPADKDHAQPGITFADSDGSQWTIWPEASGLIREVALAVDATAMGGQPGDSVTVSFTYPDAAIDAKLPDDAFVLDTTNSTAMPSLQALAQAAGAQQRQHASVGKDAPKLVLPMLDGKVFNLADVKAEVVILDFWATWCGPCRVNMEILEKVKVWADKENKSLAIYTIDIMETPEQAQQFIKQTGLTLPVLMDADGAIAKAYGIGPIPHTAILHQGKVVEVHLGVNPATMEESLKRRINELLAKGQAAGAAGKSQ